MRRKRHRKNSKKYIILPAIFLLFLFSVGYSAFSSEFLISGKGTIIEKGTISIGGVNVKTVTTGSGLYESEYEEGRYIYRGASPNNYLTLGEDEYRIISKEEDGTLKVIKSESIGDVVFDPGYTTSITGVTNSSSTEGTRYSSSSSDYCYESRGASSYDGCKVWGSKTTMLDSNGNNVITMPREIGGTEYNLPDDEASINTYLNTTWYNNLTSSVQNVITTYLFNVGLVAHTETHISNTLNTEKAYKWRGKVGLANVSDFIFSNTNENCTTGVSGYYELSSCPLTNSTDNWLYKDIMVNASFPWLIAPYSYSVSNCVWYVYTRGDNEWYPYSPTYRSNSILPVFYLKSDIKLSGTGTANDQFTLIN